MKKKGYYEYDQPIYPHKLCVAIGVKYDDISKCFSNYDGSDIEEYDFKRCDGYTYWGCMAKNDRRKCILLLFENTKCMTMNTCCHEVTHACEHIEEEIGMEHGGEASAYLTGWIASCINKARLGIGDFVELKEDKEE